MTAVAQARSVPPGTPIGYGGTFVTARPSTIAVLPVGYADGYHRLASNRAQVLVRGRRAPVAGRVCMDHTMVDVTEQQALYWENVMVKLFKSEGFKKYMSDNGLRPLLHVGKDSEKYIAEQHAYYTEILTALGIAKKK